MDERRGRQRPNKNIGGGVAGLPPLQQMPKQIESASLAEAQRTIESLHKENDKLRAQLNDVSSLYKRLVTENEHENFSERRVNLLKSQNIQLSRQILLLTEAIGSRACIQLEVENALATVADLCRTYMADKERLGEVSVRRTDLKVVVETAESARMKLYKNIENTATQNLQRPLMFVDHFVRHRPDRPVTMMDVCSGHLEHLNLKDVAKLESKLAELYKHLMVVNQSLQMIVSPDKSLAIQELPSAFYARLWGQVSKACRMLKESSGELLELSVLVPAAPWPLLHRPIMKELTVDSVMERLPKFPRSKVNDAREMIQALLRAMNYTTRTKHAENDLLAEELEFHRAVYQLQLEYTQTLFSDLRDGYKTFERDTNKMICEPLKAILDAYTVLQRTAAEEALRNFLTVFKLNITQVTEAVEELTRKDNKEREEMLSDFGQRFFKSIDRLRATSRDKRDDLVSDLGAATTRQKEALEQVMEVMCSGENTNPLNQRKSSVTSGRCVSEVITDTLKGGEKEIDLMRRSVKCGASTEDKNDVSEDTKTTSGPKCKSDSSVTVRKCEASSEEQNDVNEHTKTTSGQKCKSDSSARVRKNWAEPTVTDRTPSGGSSPALTSRSKRRSAIPQRGIPQSSLVLMRSKPIAVAGKGRQSTGDLGDDTDRPQSRSMSADMSPSKDSN